MTLSIVPVSLALVCVESALYGIFFVLAVTSLAVLLVRPRHDAASPPAPGSAGPSLRNALRSPLFLATCLLLMTVSAVSPLAASKSHNRALKCSFSVAALAHDRTTTLRRVRVYCERARSVRLLPHHRGGHARRRDSVRRRIRDRRGLHPGPFPSSELSLHFLR